MKKYLAAAMAAVVLLSGCSGGSGDSDGLGSSGGSGEVSTDSVTETERVTQSADTEQTPPVIEVVRKDRAYLTLDTEQVIISAEIVVLEDEQNAKLEQAQTDALKKYIYELTRGEFELALCERDTVKGKDFLSMSLDLDAELKLMDDNVISIVYAGELTDKSAPHPTHLFYSLNLDADTLEPIVFSEAYIVDKLLYDVFAENSDEAMTAKWGESYAAELGTFADVVCSEEDFISGIADGSICHYYTEDKVGLSFSLPFVLGGHIEVEVPYVLLDALKHTSDKTGTTELMQEGLYTVFYESFPDSPSEADYFISAQTNDGTLVSVYLGTYVIRDVSAGGIIVADIDSDNREEVVIHLSTSQDGDRMTLAFRLEGNMLERIADIKTENDILCEYQNGKKAKLTNTAGTFSREADITGLFDNAVFDKNGKATCDGLVTVGQIREIRLNGTKIEYVATIALDTIDALDIVYTLSAKDGEYVLTPVSVSPIS